MSTYLLFDHYFTFTEFNGTFVILKLGVQSNLKLNRKFEILNCDAHFFQIKLEFQNFYEIFSTGHTY